VLDALPRVLAAVASGLGATVLLAGALVSAVRLARRRTTRRLALANALIALGTLILSAGGLLNSALGEMDAFSVSLVAGIAVMFAGFLLTAPRTDSHAASPGTAAVERTNIVAIRRSS
jgi:drug/metabolite transporter (DMT)-like permease